MRVTVATNGADKIMEKPILSKCGYRCDLCLAYQGNVQKSDDRKKLSDGWFQIYGFRIEPENIICDGCVSGDNPRLIDKNCPVRPCAILKSVDTCGSCNNCICDKLKQRIVSRKTFEEKVGRKFSEDEYQCFVRPYESEKRLKQMQTKSKNQSHDKCFNGTP